MIVKKIFSKNADYQKFEVLKSNRNKRYKYKEFFVEGVRNINQAIKNDWEISSIIYNGEFELSNWAKNIIKTVKTDLNYELMSSLMSDISSKEDTSEILAIVKMRNDVFDFNLSKNPLILLFDRPSNKGNLGTIIRSCDAFGVDGIIVTGHSVDCYDPDVISSTMGSFFNIPCIRISDNKNIFDYIEKIKSKYIDFRIIGTTSHKQKNINNINFKNLTLLMIGNETDGLNNALSNYCDELATIPMSDNSSASSFNVACAGTVFLYEVVRQRL